MARFMASKSTLPSLATERKALIDSSSSFGAFGADAEGVRCGRSGGA
jgi:hypothetical protein